MEYDKLYNILPTEPKTWSQQEVATWLDHIGCFNLIPQFKKAGVDGSCLEILLDSDLREMGISQNIQKKKLIQWILIGLVEYKKYLKFKMKQESISPKYKNLLQQSNVDLLVESVCHINSILKQEFHPSYISNPKINYKLSNYPNRNLVSFKAGDGIITEVDLANQIQKRKPESFLDQSFCDQQQDEYSYKTKEQLPKARLSERGIFDKLKIQQNNLPIQYTQSDIKPNIQETTDAPYFGVPKQAKIITVQPQIAIQLIQDDSGKPLQGIYQLMGEDGSFGRNTDCKVCVPSDNASRIHAQLINRNGSYFIQDKGSLTGTFIFLQGRTLVKQGLIIQMGSYSFTIQSVKVDREECSVQLDYEVGQFTFSLQLDSNIMIFGRQSVPSLKDDQQLSIQHTQWSFTDEGLIVEDLQSSNGTWLRLSPPTVQSLNFPILSDRIVKIANHIYQLTTKQQ